MGKGVIGKKCLLRIKYPRIAWPRLNPLDNEYALNQMEKILGANIPPSSSLDWKKLREVTLDCF